MERSPTTDPLALTVGWASPRCTVSMILCNSLRVRRTFSFFGFASLTLRRS